MTKNLKFQKIIILDPTPQRHANLVRKLRKIGVFCELRSYVTTAEEIKEFSEVIGIIIFNDQKAQNLVSFDRAILDLDIPILTLGSASLPPFEYYGGTYEAYEHMEHCPINVDQEGSLLFAREDMSGPFDVKICFKPLDLPQGFRVTAKTQEGHPVAMENAQLQRYLLQFQLNYDDEGCCDAILKNFVFDICQAKGNWNSKNYYKYQIEMLQEQIGDHKVFLGLSGGVDSSVLGVLLHQAIGEQLVCVFIEHGLMRKNQANHSINALEQMGLNILRIDAKDHFLEVLQGVTEPNDKRRVISDEIMKILNREIASIPDVKYLAMGTLYPDHVEVSTPDHGIIQQIQQYMSQDQVPFKVIEPFRGLFKWEVRGLGDEMNMPETIINRQPFPDSGLAIRIFGEVTEEKLQIVTEADAILREEILMGGLLGEYFQYFATLPNIQTSSYQDNRRIYGHMIGIRIVESVNGIVAKSARVPWEVLEKISQRIVDEIPGVHRVVYDITSKPPAMVEWQ